MPLTSAGNNSFSNSMLNRLLDRLLELRRLKESTSLEALEKARNYLLLASIFGLLITLFDYVPTTEIGFPYPLPALPKLWLYSFVGLGIVYFVYNFSFLQFGRDIRNYSYYLEEIELAWPAIQSMIRTHREYDIPIKIVTGGTRLFPEGSEHNLFEIYKKVLMHEPLRVGDFRGRLFGAFDLIPIILGVGSSAVCFWFAYKAVA